MGYFMAQLLDIWGQFNKNFTSAAIIWKKIIAVIDATFAVAKKGLKKLGLFRIRTLDLCDSGAAFLPIELTSHLEAGRKKSLKTIATLVKV